MINDLKDFINHLQSPPAAPTFKIKDVSWSDRRVSIMFNDGRECALIIDKDGTLGLYSDNLKDETTPSKLNAMGARVMVINYFGTPSDGEF